MNQGAVQNHSSETLTVGTQWLRFFSKVLALATLFLIFMGALVTSHNAGLAVPDWPTTWGENMFLFPPSKWSGNIFFEHVHRLVASTIGLLTIVMFLSLLRFEKRSWVKWIGFAGLVAVCLQGVLGGLTVLYLLPPAVSVGHAVLGQTFFIITIVIAYVESAESESRQKEKGDTIRSNIFKVSLFFVSLIYLQLILGATMRHTASGLAIPDFPSMGGQYLPWFNAETVNAINQIRSQMGLWPIEKWQVLIHFAHRVMGVLILLLTPYLLYRVYKGSSSDSLIRSSVRTILFVTVLQFIFGVVTVLSAKSPYLTSLHVAFGAFTLGCAVIFSLRSYDVGRKVV